MRSDVPGRLDRESFATLERLLADDTALRSRIADRKLQDAARSA